mgnify:CR=1 FL=1
MDVPWELFICGGCPLFGMLVEFCDLSVRTPLDPVLPLTSLMDRLPGCLLFVVLSTFCGSQCGSLIFCCCYTYVSAVLVLCRPRVSIVLWCWGCWFGVYEAFCCQVLLFVCFVHVSNSRVQAQWRGALIFFFWRKCTMRLQKWMDDAFKGEWVCDAFMRWMDDAFKKNEWMYDAFYEKNGWCV